MFFEESGLKFSFSDSWIVSKYDSCDFYIKKALKLENNTAVDFITCKDNIKERNKLYLIEVKNFTNYEGENRERLKATGDDPIHLEIAKKIRDTIAGLIGAGTFPEQKKCNELEVFHSLLIKKNKHCESKIVVIAFIEGQISSYKTQRDNGLKAIGNEIRKLLSWIRCEIVVLNIDNMKNIKSNSFPFSVSKTK